MSVLETNIKLEIQNIINKYIQEKDFTGSEDMNTIKQIEELLEVKLPESYKWFILIYGYGGIGHLEIYGGGLGEKPSCVRMTELNRQFGIPKEYVVIENCDEYVYCLDTSKLIEGECPVIDWCSYDTKTYDYFNNFYDYFLYRLKIAVEFIENEDV